MTIEDGSKVIETQIEKTSASKGGDLPDGCSRREVSAGKGGLSRAKYIKSARTRRGTSLPWICDKAGQGQEVRVKYKATYVF
jgi:hypothetical protein